MEWKWPGAEEEEEDERANVNAFLPSKLTNRGKFAKRNPSEERGVAPRAVSTPECRDPRDASDP